MFFFPVVKNVSQNGINSLRLSKTQNSRYSDTRHPDRQSDDSDDFIRNLRFLRTKKRRRLKKRREQLGIVKEQTAFVVRALWTEK